jgi:EmrB/QacA subfamily drug resistance transporter
MPSSPSASRQHHGATFAVLALAGFAYSIMSAIVSPALPDIEHAMNTGANGGAWVLTAFLLSTSVFTPIAGRVGDMFGKERMLLVTLGTVVLGSVLCGVAGSLPVLIAGRVLQGVGGAVFPLAFGIIRDEFPLRRIPSGIALMSALIGIGGGVGIVMAGPIVEHLGLAWIFWLPLIVTVVALVATVFFVPESPVKTPGRVNYVSALLLSGWLVALLVAVSQGSDWGWNSGRTLGLLAIAVVIAAAWMRREQTSREPLVDMQTMRVRGVWTVNLAALMLGAGMYSAFILIPTFVQEPVSSGYGFGASITEAGLYLLPSSLLMLIAGPIAGRLTGRFGARTPLVAGSAITTVAFLLLAAEHDQSLAVYIGSALMGIGIGLAFASLANLIVEAVSPEQTGVATGINTMVRTVGGAIGSTIGAAVLTSTVVGGMPTAAGYTDAFLLAAAAGALSLVASLIVPRTAVARGLAAPETAAAG